MKQIHAALVARPGIAELLVTHEFKGAWVGECATGSSPSSTRAA